MNLEFSRFTLSNGLTLLVKENHYAQSVVVRGRLVGGANEDPPHQPGLAAFTTGVMRRGTQRRTFAQINEAVESIGASVYVNCGRHLTAFGGKSLAEDFELLVELMADNLTQPAFPEREIEKLRGQITTNLKELEDSPRGMAHRHFRQTLYGPAHPYGRPFNGTIESIAAISRADMLPFYRRLQPDGGLIVVVGDVNGPAVFERLEASLGGWQPAPAEASSPLPTPRPLTETVRHSHPMPDKSQADLVLGYIGPSRFADDYYQAYVADTILGHLGLGGRIGQIVRDQEGMAYYARTDLSAGLGPTPWYVYAGVNPVNLNKAIDLILAEVKRFCTQPVTAQELADAKSYLTGVLPLQMETNEGVANTLLEIELFNLGDDFIARFPALIEAITRDEVLAVARKYLSDTVYALAIAGPEKN